MPPKKSGPQTKADKNKPKSKADKDAERKRNKDKKAAKAASAGGTVPNNSSDKGKTQKK